MFFYIPSAGCPKCKPDAAGAECSGMLEIRPWEEAHPTTAVVGTNMAVPDIAWALMDFPGIHIVEYEPRINYMLPKPDMAHARHLRCGEVQRLPGDGRPAHPPHVIAGGILQENPFYAPPDETLEELRGWPTREGPLWPERAARSGNPPA